MRNEDREARLHAPESPQAWSTEKSEGLAHSLTTLEVCTHASASVQRDAVTLLESQSFPSDMNVEMWYGKKLNYFSELVVGAWRFELQTSCAQGS